MTSSTKGVYDDGLLDLLEGKLAVVRFQIKIREELEAKALQLEACTGRSESSENEETSVRHEANLASSVREKVKELSSELKSITQLYNDYAVPFDLWEVDPIISTFIYLLILRMRHLVLKEDSWSKTPTFFWCNYCFNVFVLFMQFH